MTRMPQNQQSSARIFTLTANTAIDHFLTVNCLTPGADNVAADSVEFASGKGVNVAKAVASLGGQVTALGFVGCQTQAVFAGLNSARLVTDFTLVEGRTRTNITLSDRQTHTEIHLRTNGFTVSLVDCDKLMDKLAQLIAEHDIVIISGGLPEGDVHQLYPRIIELCHQQAARIFLDSSGEALLEGVKALPDLIKPNQQEFEQLVGKKCSNAADIAAAARVIIGQGIARVIVSRGKLGAMVLDAENAFLASVQCSEYGYPVTQVGCGDALLGGFAWAEQQGQTLREAIGTGVACATASLFTADPGRFDQKLLDQIKNRVCIRHF